jgi:glucose/arabinose dehydrogenase
MNASRDSERRSRNILVPSQALWSATRLILIILSFLFGVVEYLDGQTAEPAMVDPSLAVRKVAANLASPTSMAFLGPDDMLFLEKNSGQVKRLTNGVVIGTVLDLAVNSASERGLLGVGLHPDFPTNPGVYLYWTCRTAGPPTDPFVQDQERCAAIPESGTDTEDLLAVPLLGNRVDRFVWTEGGTLTFDRNLIMLRAFQNDGALVPANQGDNDQPPRGNHNGGVLRFGPDGKLYILTGDLGRRSWLQNLPSGPTETGLGTAVADDQFGGPEVDDRHFSGAILRLNDDGSTPKDNPFFSVGATMGGEVGANIQKIFVYGIRNSFGMAVDPVSGFLWFQENGEDAFDELNRAEPGMNGGWIQIMGPLSRLGEYKQIETTSVHAEDFPNLQQLRWPPQRIADNPEDAMLRLFALPGARYRDPEFSWRYVLAPAAIGFLNSEALGPQFSEDLFVGFSLPQPLGGPLFRFDLTRSRRSIATDDSRLDDGVADNLDFSELTESESLLAGRDFGVITDIKTGPNGNLS